MDDPDIPGVKVLTARNDESEMRCVQNYRLLWFWYYSAEEGEGEGVEVTSVMKGSLAGLAGVKDGDRIVKIDGEPVADLFDLKRLLTFMEKRIGTITVLRDGGTKDLTFDRAWTAP